MLVNRSIDQSTWPRRGGRNGDVQDRHDKDTAGGGDQLVGRVMASLPIDKKEFHALSVTFPDGEPSLSTDDDTWTQLDPCFDYFPTTFNQSETKKKKR